MNAGRVTQARIDDAVRRILTKKFELGLFEAPLANRSGAAQIGSQAHRDVARQAVRESLVLLKNTGSFLPLSPTTTVCVTGNGASNLRAQMGAWTLGWQQPLITPVGTTILQGVTQVVGAARVVSRGCQVGHPGRVRDPAVVRRVVWATTPIPTTTAAAPAPPPTAAWSSCWAGGRSTSRG